MGRFFLFILLSTIVTSCQWNMKDIPDEQTLFKEEFKKIDWKKVDTYPSIDLCDTLLDDIARRNCFFTFISENLQAKLNIDTLDGKFDSLDTLKIMVTIDANEQTLFELYAYPDSLKSKIQVLDSILQRKDNDFPIIHAATKRGIPVRTQFVIPVILNKQ